MGYPRNHRTITRLVELLNAYTPDVRYALQTGSSTYGRPYALYCADGETGGLYPFPEHGDAVILGHTGREAERTLRAMLAMARATHTRARQTLRTISDEGAHYPSADVRPLVDIAYGRMTDMPRGRALATEPFAFTDDEIEAWRADALATMRPVGSAS